MLSFRREGNCVRDFSYSESMFLVGLAVNGIERFSREINTLVIKGRLRPDFVAPY